VPDHVTVEVVPMSHFAACCELVRLLGRSLSGEENAQVQAWCPDGINEAHLPVMAECLQSGLTPFFAAVPERSGGLRLVSGG
jgi:hypothetical protein